MAKDVTLVAIDFERHKLTRWAIEQTLQHIDAREIVTISDQEIYPGERLIKVSSVRDMIEYNTVMLKGVNGLVTSGHALYVQYDGFAIRGSQWTDDFLKYDYIGAPWPDHPEGKNVGNGGFSLRSTRLLEACQDPEVQLLPEHNYISEDATICRNFRPMLEQRHGIQFAPTPLARQFSYEVGPTPPAGVSFGVHGLWNVMFFAPRLIVEIFVDDLEWSGWNKWKWGHCIGALWQRKYIDLCDYAIEQLKQNQPNMVPVLIQEMTPFAQQVYGGQELLLKLQK